MMLSRTRSAAAPSAEDRLRDLLDLHAARPGVTEATLGAATLADGRTGYALLAGEVPEGAPRVLELGCGNGPLLAAVRRARPGAMLAGIDACAADLALARARAPDAELRADRGDALSFTDASFDVVLSHHAFYLFDPMDACLAEVARVLRPGGLFGCVTWTFSSGDAEPFASLMRLLGDLAAREVPSFRGWADRRHFDRAALRAALHAAGFGPLEVEEHALVLDEPPAAIADRLLGFFYTVDLLPEATRAELRAGWIELLRGPLHFPFALTRAVRERAPSHRAEDALSRG
jgi:SAM-dependent methyltransferase